MNAFAAAAEDIIPNKGNKANGMSAVTLSGRASKSQKETITQTPYAHRASCK